MRISDWSSDVCASDLGDTAKYLVPDHGIASFMEYCSSHIGDTYFRTPRTTITPFINLLAVLEQNLGTSWQNMLGTLEIKADTGGSQAQVFADEEEYGS